MKTKKLDTKFKKQIVWFIGIYIASIIGLGIFHEFIKLLIEFLKYKQ